MTPTDWGGRSVLGDKVVVEIRCAGLPVDILSIID